MAINLLSTTARVETPFIIVTIGNYTFGAYSKKSKNVVDISGNYTKTLTTYPNYMKSLTINKVNGAVNTYTLNMIYAITPGDDPNLLEKVFGSVSSSRAIKISYGDLSSPMFIYKEEEAIITDIKSSFNIESSTINYTLSCTSTALSLSAGTFSFSKRKAKPSDVIKEILYDTRYGLLDVFYGMRDKDKVLQKGLILSDDQEVTLEAQRSITILDYLKYLVKCMSNIKDNKNNIIKQNIYTLVIMDDTTGIWGGPYFKISKLGQQNQVDTSDDIYEIDVGSFSKDSVLQFSVEDNQTYSILYNYSKDIQQSDYIYRIDNNGKIISEYSPTISNSRGLMKTTELDKNWWTNVTQYPLTVSITLKGLLRPAILMSYVKLNILFYGRKHIHSGYYIITSQTDSIDDSGYRTTLKLTRIKGDSYDN